MTDKAFPRQDFDRGFVFVVQRAFLLSGKELAPGTIFDKSLVDSRKLKQLYDQRYLRLAEADELPQSKPRSRARLSEPSEGNHGSGESTAS